jgi:hypothetical protein
MNKDELKESIKGELGDLVDDYNVDYEVVEVNTDDPSNVFVLVKMQVCIVPEDNYIGLSHY